MIALTNLCLLAACSGTPLFTALAREHRGTDWLAFHQNEAGYWDCDDFGELCPRGERCDGPGADGHDVGVTGLALLALLNAGNTLSSGPEHESVVRGIKWLRDGQHPRTGALVDQTAVAFLYDHAIGTLALCEAYYFSKSPLVRRTAQLAVDYILSARNPYGAWRYAVPPNGDNDTSITSWMVLALASAEQAGLKVDAAAFEGALDWLDRMTDERNGRVGYTRRGSRSARIQGVNDHFPVESGEALTAAALLARFCAGQRPATHPIMQQHADLLLRSLPAAEAGELNIDHYYLFFGTYAMFQMGGKHWSAWQRALESFLHADGDTWDPSGPWGPIGGRVYATSMMSLCVAGYFRYGKFIGAR